MLDLPRWPMCIGGDRAATPLQTGPFQCRQAHIPSFCPVQAVIALQQRCRQARILYVSATG